MKVTAHGKQIEISGAYIKKLEARIRGCSSFSNSGYRTLYKKGIITSATPTGVTPFGRAVVEEYRRKQKENQKIVNHVKQLLCKPTVIQTLEFIGTEVNRGAVNYRMCFEYDGKERQVVVQSIWTMVEQPNYNTSTGIEYDDRYYHTHNDTISNLFRKYRESDFIALRLEGFPNKNQAQLIG